MASPSRRRHRLRQVTNWLLYGLALGCLAIGALILMWGERGGTLLTVQTGSMQPTIHPGDAVAVRRVSPLALRVGDIVSYRVAGTRTVVTHRIVHLESSSLVLTTQGDNLEQADSPISSSQVVGRAVYMLPQAGRMVDLLQGWPGLILGLYLPVAWIGFSEIKAVVRACRYPQYQAFSYRH